METIQVSAHQVRIYLAAKSNGGWMTANELAESAAVAPRTARHHSLRFVSLGIFEQADVFPGHRYRLSKLAAKRDKAFVDRLNNAASVFADGVGAK